MDTKFKFLKFVAFCSFCPVYFPLVLNFEYIFSGVTMWDSTVQGLSSTSSPEALVAKREHEQQQQQQRQHQDSTSSVNENAVVSGRNRNDSYTSNIDDDGASSIHPLTQVFY